MMHAKYDTYSLILSYTKTKFSGHITFIQLRLNADAMSLRQRCIKVHVSFVTSHLIRTNTDCYSERYE